jgi:hypothetical protein
LNGVDQPTQPFGGELTIIFVIEAHHLLAASQDPGLHGSGAVGRVHDAGEPYPQRLEFPAKDVTMEVGANAAHDLAARSQSHDVRRDVGRSAHSAGLLLDLSSRRIP